MASLPLSGWDALYRRTDQPKSMILTFSDGTVINNDKICMEQMSLEESLCSEENLRYGCCESSCFQVQIVNTEQSFKDLYVNVVQAFPPQMARLVGSDSAQIVDNDGNYIDGADLYYAQYGNFRVISDVPTSDRQYRSLICYDKMYDIIHANVYEWYEDLTFPMSVKDFRDSFFNYLDIPQAETELINDDYMIQGEFYASEELSGRIVIEAICELNGVFGHISRDDIFEYISLPSEESIEHDHYVNGSCVYEDYETETITGIRAINVQGDSGTIVGDEGNMYLMQSNILTFGDEGTDELTSALNTLLDVISEFTYTPFKVTTYGNPMLPLGTNVTFETKYKTINSFVMTRFLSGIQALRDTFTTLGDKVYPDDVNRIKNEIQRSAGQTHKLTNDVNTLDSEIFDEHGNSRIQQTLKEIVLKVDSNGKLVKVELGENASQGSTFRIDADYIDIHSNTIDFNNNGYTVRGEVYETLIKPDEFNVLANYPTRGKFQEDLSPYYYELSRNVQIKNLGYGGYEAEAANYRKRFSPSDPRYPYVDYEQYAEANTISDNCVLLSSPQTYSWRGGYWNTSGIHRWVEENDGSVWTYYAIVGQHNVLFPSAWTSLLADGATIDDDGYLVMPDNDKPLSYYMANQGYCHNFSMGVHALNENDTTIIGLVKVHYEDFFDHITPSGFDEVETFGEDLIFAVQPSMTISEEDIYDFSGYYWGKTALGRTSLKNTINGLQVQSSSDKRLKRDIEEIDDRLVKAICDCPTYQFKFYNEDVTTVGIIAQDFVLACEKYGIDPNGYSLCQKRTVKDDDDTEYYYIEYSQYLTLKSIHLQNQIDELKELMKK